MATAPLIGQNRAYYIPALFGANAGGGAGTPALSGATGLNDILAALLANFNPSIGTQRIPMGMGGGGDSISDAVTPGGGSEIPVNPVEALGTLGTLANVAGTAGTIGSILGIPDAGTLGNVVGTIAKAGQTYYSDAARDQITNQTNRDLEMAGLEGNYDLGRTGYDPSLAAASQIAPMLGLVAGANPIIGGLAREGLMMAADPVPSTPGDLVRAGVDAIVPGIINAIVTGLTGSTIGTNIKGGMTPVAESIARTPEEFAREEAARVQTILDGLSAEGAPVETVVPTPVADIPPQDEATVNALIDAMAAASEPAPTILGALGAETIARDLNFAESQSVRGPVLNAEPEPVTPPSAPGIFDFSGLADLAKAFSIPLSIGAIGAPPGGFLTTAAKPAAPPPAPPVAEPPPAPTGFDTSPETINAIFESMLDYQQMIENESSMGSSTDSSYGDYSGGGYGSSGDWGDL